MGIKGLMTYARKRGYRSTSICIDELADCIIVVDVSILLYTFRYGCYHSKDLVKIMETHRCSQEIISIVIRHAQKEDRELIPILKKYENNF